MNEELSGVLQQQNAEIDQFLRAQVPVLEILVP
jgi:hypothetical protein